MQFNDQNFILIPNLESDFQKKTLKIQKTRFLFRVSDTKYFFRI